jgi:hypothetical protein
LPFFRIMLRGWGGFYLIGGHGAKLVSRLFSSPLLWERVARTREARS